MSRRLTIAIPTYNRAELLEKQLDWLTVAVRGHEQECEILVSDNASNDHTESVIRRYLEPLRDSGLFVRHHRQSENVGAIRNIAHCIESARGEYVWTISDDDEIAANAVGSVLATLRRYDDLTLLVLNFSTRHHRTGKRKFEKCFDNRTDEVADNGKALFERYLAQPNPSRWGGLALTTAVIYRSEVARAALASWPEGLRNLTVQLYVSGYCAQSGRTVVTCEPLLEMIGGRHFFEADREFFADFRYAQVPEAFVRLIGLGYSPAMLQQKILEVRSEVRWSLLLRLFISNPAHTGRILRRYFRSLLEARRLARGPRPLLRAGALVARRQPE
jgi:abequosyltransferase